MSKERQKEFRENRTSWKWFENQFNRHHYILVRMKDIRAFEVRLQIEILKELQFMNDKKKI